MNFTKWYNRYVRDWVESQHFCNECCDPNHWWEGELPNQYVKPIIPLTGNFTKFDYENYKPRPKTEEEIKCDAMLKEESEAPLWMKIDWFLYEILHMDKTPEQERDEILHESWWKSK